MKLNRCFTLIQEGKHVNDVKIYSGKKVQRPPPFRWFSCLLVRSLAHYQELHSVLVSRDSVPVKSAMKMPRKPKAPLCKFRWNPLAGGQATPEAYNRHHWQELGAC